MNKTDAEKWAQEHKMHCSHLEFDEPGNEWRTVVYRIGEEYFLMNFLNGKPRHHGRDAAGEYDYGPIKVTRKTRMREEAYYVDEGGFELFNRLDEDG